MEFSLIVSRAYCATWAILLILLCNTDIQGKIACSRVLSQSAFIGSQRSFTVIIDEARWCPRSSHQLSYHAAPTVGTLAPVPIWIVICCNILCCNVINALNVLLCVGQVVEARKVRSLKYFSWMIVNHGVCFLSTRAQHAFSRIAWFNSNSLRIPRPPSSKGMQILSQDRYAR